MRRWATGTTHTGCRESTNTQSLSASAHVEEQRQSNALIGVGDTDCELLSVMLRERAAVQQNADNSEHVVKVVAPANCDAMNIPSGSKKSASLIPRKFDEPKSKLPSCDPVDENDATCLCPGTPIDAPASDLRKTQRILLRGLKKKELREHQVTYFVRRCFSPPPCNGTPPRPPKSGSNDSDCAFANGAGVSWSDNDAGAGRWSILKFICR